MSGQELAGNAKLLLLGRIGIGNKSALEHVGGAGDLRQHGGKQPAGTTLRGHDLGAPRLVGGNQAASFFDQGRRKHRASQKQERYPSGNGYRQGRQKWTQRGERLKRRLASPLGSATNRAWCGFPAPSRAWFWIGPPSTPGRPCRSRTGLWASGAVRVRAGRLVDPW